MVGYRLLYLCDEIMYKKLNFITEINSISKLEMAQRRAADR